MDKQAFLAELEHRLRHLPYEDRMDALEYYSEYFDDLNPDPGVDVCMFVGTPKEVARQIIDQTVERRIDEQAENNTTKGSGKVIWLSILGLCASPIALPLAIVAILVLIVLLISVICVLVSFYTTGGALTLGGIGCSILGFFTGNIPTTIVQAGEGFILTGIGLLIILGTAKLTRLLSKGIIAIVKKGIYRRKRNREVNNND